MNSRRAIMGFLPAWRSDGALTGAHYIAKPSAVPVLPYRCSGGVASIETRRIAMLCRSSISAVGLLCLTITGAAAFDDAMYPDWKGQWTRMGSGNFDPGKPRGTGQQAPLTPEYQAILEASLADQ